MSVLSMEGYACGFCGKVFAKKSQMECHSRIHTGEKPFICSHFGCGKAFSRKDHQNRHELTHTGTRNYKCPVPDCTKSFVTCSQLKRHQNVHTNPNPYSCPQCTVKFSKKSSMREHCLQVHNSSEFICKYAGCGKQFLSQTRLERHWLTHEKRYICRRSDCFVVLPTYFAFRKHNALHRREVGDNETNSSGQQGDFDDDRYDDSLGDDFDYFNDDCDDGGNFEADYLPWDEESISTGFDIESRTARECGPPSETRRDDSSTIELCLPCDLEFNSDSLISVSDNISVPEVEQTLSSTDPVSSSAKTRKRSHEESSASFSEQSQVLKKSSLAVMNGAFESKAIGDEITARRNEGLGNFVCPFEGCGRSFTQVKNLNAHLSAGHTKKDQFKCPEPGCNQSFGWKSVLKRHIFKIHELGKSPRTVSSPYRMRRGQSGDTELEAWEAMIGNDST